MVRNAEKHAEEDRKKKVGFMSLLVCTCAALVNVCKFVLLDIHQSYCFGIKA